MKKHVMIAVLAGCALLAVGCGKKNETEKTTETAAATEAVKEDAAEETTEAAEAEEAAAEEVTEAAEAAEAEGVTEAAEETEAATEVTEAAAEEAEEETETAGVKSSVVELGERPTYKASDYVEMGTYTDLPVDVQEIVIADAAVDAAIARAVSGAGKLETVTEGTVQEGDIANIDYVGKKDDVAFDGGTAEGFDLTIGSGMFIPGFEEGLIGVKIGDTVDLNLTFPEVYQSADLAGADVVFTVTVNSVQRAPELTDALVSEISGGAYSTVDGYKEFQKKTLTEQAEQAQESQITNDLMTQLYNLAEIKEYPQDVLDYSITEMNNYYAQLALSYGMEFDDFIQNYFGMDREAYDSEAAEVIRVSIEQEMILLAIAEEQGLDKMSDEEFAKGCEEYAKRLGAASVDELKENYGEAKIRTSLAMDNAMNFVRENAAVLVHTEDETEESLEEAVTEALTE